MSDCKPGLGSQSDRRLEPPTKAGDRPLDLWRRHETYDWTTVPHRRGGATPCIAASDQCWRDWAGSRRTATRFTRGSICLSSSSHSALVPYSNSGSLSCCRQGVRGLRRSQRRRGETMAHEHDGDSPARLLQRRHVKGALTRMTSGASATKSPACLRKRRIPGASKAVVETDVTLGPAQFLQCLAEMLRTGLENRDRSLNQKVSTPMRRMRSGCCARAANGHAPPHRRAA